MNTYFAIFVLIAAWLAIMMLGVASGITKSGAIALLAWTIIIWGIAYGVWRTEKDEQ